MIKPEVVITPVFMVDCSLCGGVNSAIGDCTSRRSAQEMRQEHIRWHRRVDPTAPQLAVMRKLERAREGQTAKALGCTLALLVRLQEKEYAHQSGQQTWRLSIMGEEFLKSIDQTPWSA